MPISLKKSLAYYGCELSTIEFRRLLVDVKTATYPGMSDEDLTYTVVQVNDYCDAVRSRAGCPALPRTLILKALIGVRKRSIGV